jgi:hypothetical protein
MFAEDDAQMLDALHAVGAGAAVQMLASRIADQVDIYWLWDTTLLAALRAAGAGDTIRALSAYVTEQVWIEAPDDVAELLAELREAGSADAVQALLARGPARLVAIDASQPFRPGYQRAFARLLTALRAAGAAEAERDLARRAADAGMFGLFLGARPDEAARYRSGREPGGAPSPPWNWLEPGVSGL